MGLRRFADILRLFLFMVCIHGSILMADYQGQGAKMLQGQKEDKQIKGRRIHRQRYCSEERYW